ncbi:glycosylated lysosomal membrane protein-like [Symsagittifera roscoffensis]|uniref:glycosylated lysosomal membrane protein-like n=1 Tax=Symsagittifera roscoffensis TaxID=84072 RepID=UPI00307BDC3F
MKSTPLIGVARLSPPQYNPNCGENNTICSSESGVASHVDNLLLTKSTSASDTLFFAWSTIGGAPSLVLIRTAPGAEVTVDWSDMQTGISAYPQLKVTNGTILSKNGYVFTAGQIEKRTGTRLRVRAEVTVDWSDIQTGILAYPQLKVTNGTILSKNGYVFTAIWKCETDDPGATSVKIPVDLSDCSADKLTRIPLDETVLWYNNSHTIASISNIGYSFSFRSDDSRFGDGELTVQVTIYKESGRSDSSTGLEPSLHSENSTQFMLALDNFPDSGKARYSLEHLYISAQGEDITFKTHRGLNDQFTPGVFQYQQYNAHAASGQQTFFGWKQAGYKSPKLDLQNIVTVYFQQEPEEIPVANGSGAFKNVSSLATDFFSGTRLLDRVWSVSFNMTFGSSVDDDGYDHYLTWEGQMGYGTVEYDELTVVIISITAVGIFVPLAVIVLGGVLVFVLKRRREKFYDLQQHAHADRTATNTPYTDNESDANRPNGFNYQQM